MSTSSIVETVVESKPQVAATLVFSTYEDAFAQWLREQDRSENSVSLYLIGLRDFTAWFESTGDKTLEPALITPLDVRAYRRYLQDTRQLKPSSVNSYIAAVRAFCRWAMSAGLASGDPTSGIKSVKIVAEAPRWLDRQEQYKLLRAAQEQAQLAELKAGADHTAPVLLRAYRDRAIVVLALNTGLRLSEIASLRTDSMTINARSGNVKVVGKGNKARTVPLNKDARAAVSAWLEIRPEIVGCATLFTSQKQRALTPRSVARRIEYVGLKAGIKVTPHQLRHSLAKNLVDEGVSLDRVGMALGHASLDTTRRYTMPSRADMQDALERVAWSD